MGQIYYGGHPAMDAGRRARWRGRRSRRRSARSRRRGSARSQTTRTRRRSPVSMPRVVRVAPTDSDAVRCSPLPPLCPPIPLPLPMPLRLWRFRIRRRPRLKTRRRRCCAPWGARRRGCLRPWARSCARRCSRSLTSARAWCTMCSSSRASASGCAQTRWAELMGQAVAARRFNAGVGAPPAGPPPRTRARTAGGRTLRGMRRWCW